MRPNRRDRHRRREVLAPAHRSIMARAVVSPHVTDFYDNAVTTAARPSQSNVVHSRTVVQCAPRPAASQSCAPPPGSSATAASPPPGCATSPPPPSCRRQPVSLLPRQGRAAVLLPGPLRRSPAHGARRGAQGSPAAAGPLAPDGGGARAVWSTSSRGRRRISRSMPCRPASVPASSSSATPTSAASAPSSPAASAPVHFPGRRRHHRDARLSRRAELDRALVPAGRAAIAASNTPRWSPTSRSGD